MKVHSFDLQNWKKVKKLHEKIDGANVFVLGRNESGKTSIIQALFCLATGAELPTTPITTGKQTAYINMEIGNEVPEYLIELEFNEKHPKGKLSVTPCTPDAKPIKSPRTFLNDLVGGLLFDPFEFIDKKPNEQVKVLKTLLNLNWDVLDTEYAEVMEARKFIKKEIVDLKGALTKYDVQPHEIEIFKKPKDLKDISSKVSGVETHNKTCAEKQARLLQVETDITKYNNGLSSLKLEQANFEHVSKVVMQQLSEGNSFESLRIATKRLEHDIDGSNILRLISEIEKHGQAITDKSKQWLSRIEEGNLTIIKLENERDELKEWLAIPDNKEKSISKINQEYQDAVNFNAKCKLVTEYSLSMMEIEEKEMVVKQHTSRLEEILEEKRRSIEECGKMPVVGLTIDVENERLLYQGLPLEEEQISKSKIIEIGIELMMSHNPKLRLCRIKDGSLFDKNHLDNVLEWIGEQGFQAFVEIVDIGDVRIEFCEV